MDDFDAFEGASFLLADLGSHSGWVGLVGEEEPRASLSPAVFVRFVHVIASVCACECGVVWMVCVHCFYSFRLFLFVPE